MPTTRPRHMVTETPDVAAALAVAARHWPEETSRSALLARLAVEGARCLDDDVSRRSEERRAAIAVHAGALAQVYGADR